MLICLSLKFTFFTHILYLYLLLQKGDRTRYFGSAIELVVEEDGVPLFVKKCVQVIEERGLKAEGIYRVSGKKEDCLALQEKYDEGMKFTSISCKDMNLRSTGSAVSPFE